MGPRSGPLPRRTVPARRPLCRHRPIGARSAKPLGQLESHQQPPLAAPRTAAAQGHSNRQPAATAAQDGGPGQLLIGK